MTGREMIIERLENGGFPGLVSLDTGIGCIEVVQCHGDPWHCEAAHGIPCELCGRFVTDYKIGEVAGLNRKGKSVNTDVLTAFVNDLCEGKEYDSCNNSPCRFSSPHGCQHPKHPKRLAGWRE